MPETTRSIHKDPQQVVIVTSKFRIDGYVHLLPNSRLTDLLNRPDVTYLPLTDAEVFTLSGETVFTSDFLSVNKAHIEFISPVPRPAEQSADATSQVSLG